MPYDYIHEPDEIYRQSFATIRQEIDLTKLPADIEPVALRLIHTTGDFSLLENLTFSQEAGLIGKSALSGGCTILTDVEMVGAGITRRFLPTPDQVMCTLNDPDIPTLAKEKSTTRSAAALDYWFDHLEGAVVAIGNAPTALFRLLEMLDEGAPEPALIIGMPVGFVGAVESKEALIAHGSDIPYITIRGRRGGSALAAATVNALAAKTTPQPE
ncbi:MAG: precorrin-8X methylmutase [Rhodospirillales bacterium]|nr:precorrin-8X methylmutase [Rhodospirillales bacterium]